MQRRSLINNAFKIKLAADKLPVSFVAFDLLYLNGEEVMTRPLIERKKLLQDTVTENDRFAIARHIDEKGIDLYRAAKQQGLEGVIAKRGDSRYSPGKRTKDWIKFKNWLDDDFVVCGYYFKADNLLSVILGSYSKDQQLVYQGHVVMGISREDYRHMQAGEETEKNRYYVSFPDFDGARWLKTELVCKVEYMERTNKGGLRQPAFRGLRDDKEPRDCKAI